jgi:hypothetical protein
MAVNTTASILDCAHINRDPAGVCQFQRCGRVVCTDCLGMCTSCWALLCREHQVVLHTFDGQPRIYCSDDSTEHVVKKAVLYLLNRRQGG